MSGASRDETENMLKDLISESKLEFDKLKARGCSLMAEMKAILGQSQLVDNEDNSRTAHYYPNANKWFKRLQLYMECTGQRSKYQRSLEWHESYQEKLNQKIKALSQIYYKQSHRSLANDLSNLSVKKQ